MRSFPECGKAVQWLTVVVALIQPLLAATVDVVVKDNEYVPRFVTIAPGDTVRWLNEGTDHTVTADQGGFDSTEEGEATLPAGGTFSHTFPEAGRFLYYCLLHGGPGLQDMSGAIRVVDPALNTPPATPTNVSPAGGAANVSTAPTLSASAFSDANQGDIHLSSQWSIRNVTVGSPGEDLAETTTNLTSLPLTGLLDNTTYAWKVRYKDDLGAWSDYSSETQFTTVAPPTVGGEGLTATYSRYNPKTGVATPVVTTTDPKIEFDWKLAKPHPRLPPNNFAITWEGSVLPKYSERYRFRIRADGGVRLWVKGVELIDDFVVTPFAVFRNNVIELEAGVPVPIKIEYFDTTNNASINLRWSSPTQATEVIPQTRLFPVQP